jgi:two-component sensor histidine kinase
MALIDWVIDIARSRRTGAGSWGLAGAFLAAAIVVRLALARWLEPEPFITLYPAVVASALFCGWRLGAAVLVLSAVAAWYLFLAPVFSFTLSGYGAVQLAGYLLVSTVLVMLVEGLVQAVRRLEHTARANEGLFRELQHRVANSLQIVVATLQKARRGIEDPVAVAALDQAIARIHSMAGLHRRLYDSAAYSQGLEPILTDVVAETFRDLPVSTRLDIHSEDLSVGEMTAIALLVNEAAINAAKHVFRPQRGALFEVSLVEVERGHLQLTILDDGPGMAPMAAAEPQTQKFGLAVMRGLAEQLGGSLETLNEPGATLKVRFRRALGAPKQIA